MINQLTEILLYSLILSLYINALHIMLQKEMVLNWLYTWLESKFRNRSNISVCELDYELELIDKDNIHISYNKEFDITKKWK